MFTELTNELLDLTATVKGDRRQLFAAFIDCCCCSSSCGCLIVCH